MIKWIKALLAEAKNARRETTVSVFMAGIQVKRRDAEITSLRLQLTAAQATAAQKQNNYLVVVDELADLRVRYEKLAYERLNAWGLHRAGGEEHPGKGVGLAGHLRRSAPNAGDR